MSRRKKKQRVRKNGLTGIPPCSGEDAPGFIDPDLWPDLNISIPLFSDEDAQESIGLVDLEHALRITMPAALPADDKGLYLPFVHLKLTKAPSFDGKTLEGCRAKAVLELVVDGMGVFKIGACLLWHTGGQVVGGRRAWFVGVDEAAQLIIMHDLRLYDLPWLRLLFRNKSRQANCARQYAVCRRGWNRTLKWWLPKIASAEFRAFDRERCTFIEEDILNTLKSLRDQVKERCLDHLAADQVAMQTTERTASAVGAGSSNAEGQPYGQSPNEFVLQQPDTGQPGRSPPQDILSNVEFLHPIFNIYTTIPDALDEPMDDDVASAVLVRIMAHPQGPATLERLRELCPDPWKVVANPEACDLAETLRNFALFDSATGQSGKLGIHLAYSTFPFECLTSHYQAGEELEADAFRRTFEENLKYKGELRRFKKERQKYKKGPRAKAERTERRNELITRGIDVGMKEPEEIFEFIKGQDLDLVRNGNRFVDPEIMMKNYWKRRRAKGQSHQGSAQQN
jgi:hypothetical protein